MYIKVVIKTAAKGAETHLSVMPAKLRKISVTIAKQDGNIVFVFDLADPLRFITLHCRRGLR